jgi:hypothetical protein
MKGSININTLLSKRFALNVVKIFLLSEDSNQFAQKNVKKQEERSLDLKHLKTVSIAGINLDQLNTSRQNFVHTNAKSQIKALDGRVKELLFLRPELLIGNLLIILKRVKLLDLQCVKIVESIINKLMVLTRITVNRLKLDGCVGLATLNGIKDIQKTSRIKSKFKSLLNGEV